MSASSNDYFVKVGSGTATTLSAPGYTVGGTSLTVGSTANWPTDTGVIFAIDEVETVDGVETQVEGSLNIYEGTVASGTSITNVDHLDGTDQNYSAGASTRVYIIITDTRENRFVDGMLIEHDQDGTHAGITSTSITNTGAFTTTGTTTLNGTYDGWVGANETWTYASGTGTNVGTFTITGDVSSKYQAGMKIKFTQTTVKYAIITKVAVSTDTTITIYMGTDYTIANAAISANYYSRERAPQGFPIEPSKWTVSLSSSTDRSTSSATYATLTDALTVPIGAWTIKFKVSMINTGATITNTLSYVTLSSDASTETNPELTCYLRKRSASAAGTSTNGGTMYTESDVTLASSTTFTMMGKTNADTLNVSPGESHNTLIKAVCAYL